MYYRKYAQDITITANVEYSQFLNQIMKIMWLSFSPLGNVSSVWKDVLISLWYTGFLNYKSGHRESETIYEPLWYQANPKTWTL